ncbi:MAG: ABC transporter permease [Nitrospirae bacterium]|nr:MAG: ABC transporter permease [Nitrospirota bacterium]
MRGFGAILGRELRAYAVSPIAYILVAVLLLLGGYFNFDIVTFYAAESLRAAQFPGMAEQFTAHQGIFVPLFSNLAVVLLLILPLLTMRLLAEERARGTYELLYTAPVNLTGIVLGKYAAALVLYTLFLAVTLVWPGYTATLLRVDWGAIGAAYLGLWLMGAVFIGVGLLASSLTQHQLIAAVIGFGVLLLSWVIGWAGHNLEGAAAELLRYLSLLDHLDNFLQGVIDTRDVVYFASFASLALLATQRVLDSQRWRS